MNLRFIVFLLFILSSCSKKEETPMGVPINGIVIDQVTKLPIFGASISPVIDMWCDGGPYSISEQSLTLTDIDGHYSIANYIRPKHPITGDPACVRVCAKKSGYIGSDWANLTDDLISLYHSAEFNLQVKNDTISNNFDEVEIKIFVSSLAYSPFNSQPIYTAICKGRNYENVYRYSNFWGNLSYNIKVYQIANNALIKNIPFIPLPDTINELQVTF